MSSQQPPATAQQTSAAVVGCFLGSLRVITVLCLVVLFHSFVNVSWQAHPITLLDLIAIIIAVMTFTAYFVFTLGIQQQKRLEAARKAKHPLL